MSLKISTQKLGDGAVMDVKQGQIYVGGEWVAPVGTAVHEVISPSTEEIIARVALGSPEDIDRAVDSARSAFDAKAGWATFAVAERVSILRAFRDLVEQNSERLAQTLTAELGSPISQSRSIQLGSPIRFMDYYLELAANYPFRSIRRHPTGNALVTREPVGVVGAIVPWNMPAHQAISKMFPALLAGCTLVLKPVPQTSIHALILAELADAAGIPPGVFSVVPCRRDAGERLVTHQGVDKVTFTGSTAAGERIAALCAQGVRRVTLELGGKSAGVILDDADLDAAVEALRLGSFRNSGQICSLKTRILVPERLEGDVVDRLRHLVDTMPVGDPFDEKTHIGPMYTQEHRASVERYIAIGKDEGARLVAGGGRPADLDRGWYVEPTVFTGVEPDSTLAQEEVFGPVLSVITYRDDDEAVRIANNSPYGLSGAVYTTDRDRGINVASRIRTGAVEVNGFGIGLASPFGGFKTSGIGRENGPEGLDAYTELRSIGLPPEWATE
jgi:acyl-CoA reductase-like NAD-dependent aldehyde dehydrogenase